MRFKVPDSARSIIQQALQRNELHHAGLMFYRYLDGEDSRKHYDQLQEMIGRVQFITLGLYKERIHALCREWTLQGQKSKQVCFQARLVGRLAPGLGIPSVFENGISLHHIHGFPYIPGSSLKGIAQNYALNVREVNKNSQEFIAVFGKQTPQGKTGEIFEAQQGRAIFFDAIPLEIETENLLTLDVMTPHYTDYYTNEGKKPPADYLDPKSPNPIIFLTVKEGVSFLFCIRARDLKSKESVVMKVEDVLCYAKDWLEGALSALGAGAKTSVGYGYFQKFQIHNP